MNDNLRKYINCINQALKGPEFSGVPEELYAPIRYILDLNGKRIRPLLTLLSYGMFKDDPFDVVYPSLAVEVFHNFTLMHDDIMDNAPIRRGKATVHEKWNENIALLSGDAMLVKAYGFFTKIPEDKIRICIDKFNSCAVKVCEGQQLDMNFEERARVSIEQYLEMIKLKTAVLLGYSLELGSILGNASDADRKALQELGINLGIGFQLKDDLLDIYGETDKFGKQVGGDIISNKKTFLLIKATDCATETQMKELEYWIGLKEFNPDEKVRAMMDIFAQTNVKVSAEDKINEFFKKGYNNLDSISVDEVRKSDLRSLMDFLISRDK